MAQDESRFLLIRHRIFEKVSSVCPLCNIGNRKDKFLFYDDMIALFAARPIRRMDLGSCLELVNKLWHFFMNPSRGERGWVCQLSVCQSKPL